MLHRNKANTIHTLSTMSLVLIAGLAACGGVSTEATPGSASQRAPSSGSTTTGTSGSQTQQGTGSASQGAFNPQNASSATTPGADANTTADANQLAGSGNTWILVPGSAGMSVAGDGLNGIYYGWDNNELVNKRSTDGGNTWTAIIPAPNLACGVKWGTGDPNLAYGYCAEPNQPAREQVEWFSKTPDGGATWEVVSTAFTPLAISPFNPLFMYGEQTYGVPAVSTDGGNTWASVAAVPATDGVMFGSSPNDAYMLDGNLLWVTHDLGGSWMPRTVPVGPPNTEEYFTPVAASGNVIIGIRNLGDLYKSADDGVTWSDISFACVQWAIISPTDSNTIYANMTCDPLIAAPSNLMVTHDGGGTWIAMSPLPNCVGGFTTDTLRKAIVAVGCGIYVAQ